jgi:glycosyltransferase involved in cell wall biosynthesis
MGISALILTFNEEQNLPSCLASLSWCDDIVVFDSFSTDRTIEIAKAAGARVVQRKFDNERSQREASIKVGFKYPWVYNPDADEITTTELRDELLQITSDPNRKEVAYRVRFKTMFMGHWIKYSSLYPTWVVRLFMPEKLSFARDINLQYLVDGQEGQLKSHFEHHSFNKGLNAWIEKHNRYSWHEANEAIKSLAASAVPWTDIFSSSSVLRRRALKEISFRLPFRPTLRFLYMYVLHLGFLDGWAGLTYCRLLSTYEYLIVLKIKEIQRRNLGLPI